MLLKRLQSISLLDQSKWLSTMFRLQQRANGTDGCTWQYFRAAEKRPKQDTENRRRHTWSSIVTSARLLSKWRVPGLMITSSTNWRYNALTTQTHTTTNAAVNIHRTKAISPVDSEMATTTLLLLSDFDSSWYKDDQVPHQYNTTLQKTDKSQQSWRYFSEIFWETVTNQTVRQKSWKERTHCMLVHTQLSLDNLSHSSQSLWKMLKCGLSIYEYALHRVWKIGQ